MTYQQWEAEVPMEVRADTLWKIEAYRLGLFISDLAWHDRKRLMQDRRTFGIADQLYRAATNISSNVAEGYSRDSGKARATFYEYALGSARELRDWYYKGRHGLDEKVVDHRMDVCTQVIRLMLVMVQNERRSNRHASQGGLQRP
jgi:four helix bundle protein